MENAQELVDEPADPAADDGLPALLLHGVRRRPVAGVARPGVRLPSRLTAFQFVFVLLQSAAFSGVFVGFGVARDFEFGFAKRLMLAAPRRSGIVLGYALAALARWAIVALVLTTVALVVGMNIGGGAVDLVGLYTLAALVNFCGFFWAGGMAMRFRTIQAAPLMQMPVFLVLFFAPVYVHLNLLQGWIHGVAAVNPLTYLLETSRGFVAGDAPHVLGAFGIAIGLGVLFWIWAFRACGAPRPPAPRLSLAQSRIV